MAYLGYDTRVRIGRSQARQAKVRFAWGRLAALAASVLAWAGIIVAARAIF